MTFQVIRNPNNPLYGKTYEEVLDAVKERGVLLEFIHGGNQSEELCTSAVKQNPRALQYVRNQTEELSIMAVSEDACALRCVNRQTEAVVKAAISKNPSAVVFVDDKFYHIVEIERKIGVLMEVVNVWNSLYPNGETVHPHGGESEHTAADFEYSLGDGRGVSLEIQDYITSSRLVRKAVSENHNVQTDIDLIMNRIALAKAVLPMDEVMDNFIYSEIPKAVDKLNSLREDIKRHGSNFNTSKLINLLASIEAFR